MKNFRLFSLMLAATVLLSLGSIGVLADETTAPQETTESTAPNITVHNGQDASVVNGCRTIEGKMPLWGTQQLMPTSGAIVFYEVNSDTMVYSWEPDTVMEAASLVKIMTCLIAVENGNIADKITVTASALSSVDKAFHTLGLLPGEEVTLEQMLYCMMVGSANDAALVIAEHIGGTVTQFVAMMNQKAREIGCVSTSFVDPTGLGGKAQQTTARDMAKIVNYAIKNELFNEFFSATLYNLDATNLSQERRVQTQNYLMTPGMVAFYDQRVKGGRTGITDDRKRCLASVAEDDGLRYITIILGAEPTYNESGTKTTRFGNYEDTRDLLKLGFADHQIVQVFREKQILGQYAVSNGASQMAVGPADQVTTLLPSEVTVQDLTVRYEQGNRSASAPVTAGETIDTVQLWYKNICVAQSPLIAKNSVALAEVEDEDAGAFANTQGLSKALVIVGIILAFVLCVAGVLYCVQTVRTAAIRAQHRRRRKSRRRSR